MSNAAGIDVSKARLDAAVAGGPVRRFANTPAGIAALLEWLELAVFSTCVGIE